MSIQSESRKAGPYLGDGAQTLFPFDFKIFKADELLVVYTDLNSIERTLVLNTDYTVSLNADQDAAPGGSIHTTFAPLAGYRVTMTSKVPNLQEMVLTNNGGFYPVLLNKAFDKLTILVQQLREEVSRAVKVTLSTDKTPDQLLDSIFASALQAAEAEAQAQAAAQSAQGFVEDIAILIGKIYVRATGLVPIPVAWRGRNARVHLIGGGGGGGGGASGAANAGGGGGGGGAGAWVSSEIVLPEGAANLYAEIGLGGAGGRGALTNENAAANGASGLATTLYSRLDEPRIVLATAAGGAAGGCGGGSNRPGRIYPGAAGGNGGGGGAGAYSGTEAFGVPGNGGVGGTSCYGAGGRSGFRAGQSGSPGADGESALANTGAGGGGGGGGIQESLGISGGGSGGAGGSGLIIIELR